MLYINRKQAKIIHSNTAEEFEEALNNCLSQLDEMRSKYELQFNHSLGFCAYVIYTESTCVPETISEEYEDRGEGCLCEDCKHCVFSEDKRRKKLECSIHGDTVRKNSRCCDDFYYAFEAGDDWFREE